MFKSSINSKKRPEKRDRKSASKEESISEFGDLSSDSKRKQSSRERKEQMRLQKRSEIKERRQKDRKERYEKKKSEVMQEKKLPATVSKVPSNDTMVAEAEDEICDNIKPKRYSDRRREDKIKRENKIAAATGANPKPSTKSDEKLTDQLSNLSVNDNKTKIKSRTREEGSSKKNGSDNEGGQKRKEKHDVVEGGEERKITEEEKRRREEITARRDRERQERKERIKNKVGAKDVRVNDSSSREKCGKQFVGRAEGSRGPPVLPVTITKVHRDCSTSLYAIFRRGQRCRYTEYPPKGRGKKRRLVEMTRLKRKSERHWTLLLL